MAGLLEGKVAVITGAGKGIGKAIISATSSGVPSRPCFMAARSSNGTPTISVTIGFSRSTMAVAMNAGHTALIRMPVGLSSVAAARVSCTTPAFDAE